MPKVSDEYTAARRREILDAAARCFTRTGFHRTTISDIVAESGVSAGLLYRYFAGKDAIVAAIAEEWHDDQAARLGLPGTSGTAGAPALACVTSAYLALLRGLGGPGERDRARLGVQLWAEALRSATIHAAARAGVDGPRAVVEGLLATAIAAGDLPAALPPGGAARLFVALYQGLALQTAWDEEVDHDAFARAVEVVLAALAASAGAGRRDEPGPAAARGWAPAVSRQPRRGCPPALG